MTSEIKSHQFWLTTKGKVVKEKGNLLPKDVIDELAIQLICPILTCLFDEVLLLSPSSQKMYIPAVNLSTPWINGFFDYFLSKTADNLILWEVKDMTEITNNKLIRIQPQMEQKLKAETAQFIKEGFDCKNFNSSDETS